MLGIRCILILSRLLRVLIWREIAMKRTFQPKKRQRAREHGFLSRMKTRGGKGVIKARRTKGRAKLTTV